MNGNSFSPDIVKFLKSHLTTFFAVEYHKRLEWLKEVADKTMIEFALPKENDVRKASEYRKKIIQWFYNRDTLGCRMKYASTTLRIRNRFRLAQVLSARGLYGENQTNAARITATADALFQASGFQVMSNYVKIWNQVLDEEWNRLSEEQRRPYFLKAEKCQQTRSGPPNKERTPFPRNQDTSADDLMKPFDRLGFEDGSQSGNASG
ncbi:hypothetical protein Clacol_000149 [Clathrus columnatus]|uniref:Uncharacterized protein n=1 Tax=Clathrus columnatus TaxID=1419009 RepID=A0AAV4ZXX2_9AGAM|nr:hypothetical protein Clacol_000149 [Clathrus columnatus]